MTPLCFLGLHRRVPVPTYSTNAVVFDSREQHKALGVSFCCWRTPFCHNQALIMYSHGMSTTYRSYKSKKLTCLQNIPEGNTHLPARRPREWWEEACWCWRTCWRQKDGALQTWILRSVCGCMCLQVPRWHSFISLPHVMSPWQLRPQMWADLVTACSPGEDNSEGGLLACGDGCWITSDMQENWGRNWWKVLWRTWNKINISIQ